jgi:hypothetical protein
MKLYICSSSDVSTFPNYVSYYCMLSYNMPYFLLSDTHIIIFSDFRNRIEP